PWDRVRPGPLRRAGPRPRLASRDRVGHHTGLDLSVSLYDTDLMGFKDQLSAVLRGEAAVELDAAARESLESLADEARAAGQITRVGDECAARLRQPGASGAVDYLLAAACALNGEVERAHQTLLTLGEKLAATGRWEPLAAVAERALDLEATQAAARLLVRAHE